MILPPDEGLGGGTWEASEPLPGMDGSFGFDFSPDVMAETEAPAAQRRSRPPYREFEQQQAPQMKGLITLTTARALPRRSRAGRTCLRTTLTRRRKTRQKRKKRFAPPAWAPESG